MGLINWNTIYAQDPSNTYAQQALGITPSPAPNAQLQALQQEFLALPQAVQEALLAQTQQAGTYAPTPEFQAGFETEAAARLRGLALDNVQRQQAIQRQMGLPESPLSSAGSLDLSSFQLPMGTFNQSAQADPVTPIPRPSPEAPAPTPAMAVKPAPTPTEAPKPEAGLSPQQQAIKRFQTAGRAMRSLR